MRLTKEKGSACMRWVSCLLLAVLCLGMGTGCEEVADFVTIKVNQECSGSPYYYCGMKINSTDRACDSYLPSSEYEKENPRYCESKEFPSYLGTVYRRGPECRNCSDSNCEDCGYFMD